MRVKTLGSKEAMGIFYVVMEIGDPAGERFIPFSGLIDTGSTLTALPEGLLNSLGVVPVRRAGFELADESVVEYSVGNTTIRYGGNTVSNPIVFAPDGTEPIIGPDGGPGAGPVGAGGFPEAVGQWV